MHGPQSLLRTLLSTVPVFALLIGVLVYGTAEMTHARVLRLGESVWPDYALMRQEPVKPECDPAAFVVPTAAAPASAPAGDDDLLDGLDGGGGGAKDEISAEAVLAAKQKCEEGHALYASATARITDGLRRFHAVESGIASLVEFFVNHLRHILVMLLMICAVTASATRAQIALRNARSRLDFIFCEGAQILSGLLLFHSVYAQWRIDQSSGSMMTGSVLFFVWMFGFAALVGTSVYHLLKPPADLKAGGSIAGALAAVPLYSVMVFIAGAYFLLAEDHAPGLAIYTQLITEHPLLYIQVGLYVWIGMLLKQTRLAPLGFDLLRPWKLPPELLAFVVVVAAAVPTAYSGASGIFVMAAGALIYQELRRSGARRQLALASTAMSGSLGVVLRPCLLVVIVASLNKQVTTDELYGWGLWVYLATGTMFFIGSMIVRDRSTPLTIAPMGEALSGMKGAGARLVPYLAITAAVLLFYGLALGTVVDEHTAPNVLPVLMLFLLVYDRTRSDFGAADPRGFTGCSLDATCETSSHIGALLIMMAASVCIGGIVERSEVMHLIPQTFGSTFATMGVLVAVLVLVGMTMDPYGAVILVSASFAEVAYRNGINPTHFWMTVLTAFELGYLTPPVALNQLLARQVVGDAEWDAAKAEGGTFWKRHESVLLPCGVMGVALLFIAFVPLAFY